MRHRLWAVLAVLVLLGGVSVAILGALMATIWAPARTVTTTLAPGQTPLVVTAPGFLAMNNAEVVVTARSKPGARVFLGIARSADVNSYVGSSPRLSLIGLTAESAVISTEEPGSVPAPAPGGVDIWVGRIAADASASLTWVDRAGSWSLVVASDGTAPAAEQVTFTWALPKQHSAAPAVIAFGALLVLSGAIFLGLSLTPPRQQPGPEEPPVPPPGARADQRMERTW